MTENKFKIKIPFYFKWQAGKLGSNFLRIALKSFEVISRAARQHGLNFDNELQRLLPDSKRSINESPNLERAANRSNNLQLIVFSDRLPRPNKDSASVRLSAILGILTRLAHVYFVPVYLRDEDFSEARVLEKTGVEIVSIFDFERSLKNEKIDFIILSYPYVADYLMKIVKRRFPAAKIIYDTVDVHFVRLEREYQLKKQKEIATEAKKLKKIEVRAARAADQVWCVTKSDQQFLQTEVPTAQVAIIPNIHVIHERGNAFNDRAGLLFIGGFKHRPNLDAVFHFLEFIFPLVLEMIPDIQFHIIGSDAPPEVLTLGSKNVVVHGFIEDVKPLFASCRVFISPLRYGGGMKGKIGQALSFGLPVVTTNIGAEGMGLINQGEALIADEPCDFATAVNCVYEDEALWQKLSDGGHDFICRNFSPDVVDKRLRHALSQISSDANFPKPLTSDYN